MKFIIFLFCLLFYYLPSSAALDLGVGTSSFVAGRAIPSLAVGLDAGGWGIDYRGVGAQTTVYAQNASTVGIYKIFVTEPLPIGEAIVGAGLGGAYITRTYRESPTSSIRKQTENVGGFYLALRYRVSFFYFGADSVLGLTPSNIWPNVTLNFQDMSHITIGISL